MRMLTGDKVIEGIKKAWASCLCIPSECLCLTSEGSDWYASRRDKTGHRSELISSSSILPRSRLPDPPFVLAQVPPNLGSVPSNRREHQGPLGRQNALSLGVRFRF